MSSTLITSRDRQGAHAVGIFATAYDKASLDGDRAQMLNENGGKLQDGILALIRELTTPKQFADEEMASDYTYPEEYKGTTSRLKNRSRHSLRSSASIRRLRLSSPRICQSCQRVPKAGSLSRPLMHWPKSTSSK